MTFDSVLKVRMCFCYCNECDCLVLSVSALRQWLGDVNQKVMLENGNSVPVILLANKVWQY